MVEVLNILCSTDTKLYMLDVSPAKVTCRLDIFQAGPSSVRSTSTCTPAALRPSVMLSDLIKYLGNNGNCDHAKLLHCMNLDNSIPSLGAYI